MCRAFEELAEKRAKEAAKETAEQRALEEQRAFARRMLEDEKFSFDDITKYTGLSIEEVEKVKDSLKEM